MKKILSCILAVSLAFTAAFTTAALPAGQAYLSAYWPAFRGANDFKGLTDAKTPTTAGAAELKWVHDSGAGLMLGHPIEVGGYIYYAHQNKIFKLDRKDGTLVGTSEKAEANIGYFSTIAYGDGLIFVPLAGGIVQAFDAESLSSVWISRGSDIRHQSLSPITYHNGYIYMGVSNASATDGAFICLSADPNDSINAAGKKEYTWSYEPGCGFYWSEGAAVGESIVFAGEDGKLVSHHLTKNIVNDIFALKENNGSSVEAVRSSAHYDKDLNRVYVSTKGGSVHSIKMNANGTFDSSSYKSRFISKDLTSSPTTFKGRLYQGGGGASSLAPFSVLDADTLEIIYQIPDIKSQSSPIVSTAYATSENNWRVYIYLLKWDMPDELYCVEDSQGQKSQRRCFTIAAPVAHGNSSSLSVGYDGTLYYKNDSGNFFAYKNSLGGDYTPADVVNAINRLPSLNKMAASDDALLRLTEERYNTLSPAEKEAVTNSAALKAARERMTEITDIAFIVAKLISGISALPEINTLNFSDNDAIQALLSSYYALPDADKTRVTNIDILLAAQAKIASLNNSQKLKELEARIADIPTKFSMKNKTAIQKAMAEYDALPGELKACVSNAEKLQALANGLKALEAEIEAINDAIWALDPQNITLDDKAKIEDIMARYNKLSNDDRVYVEYYDEILEFKAIIDALELQETTEKRPTTVKARATISKNDSNKDADADESSFKKDDSLKDNARSLAPNTGDNTEILLWLFLCLLSTLTIAFLWRKKSGLVEK